MKKIMIVFVSGCMLLACNSSNNQSTSDSTTTQSANAGTDTAAAATTTNTTMNTNDFVNDAASGGTMEVKLGKLAQQKAQSPRVKRFGQMMVHDHSAANDTLKAIAKKQNITLPDSLTGDMQSNYQSLSQKSGKDFDKAYMDMMVNDHKEDINKFQNAAQNVQDSAVKAFAAKTLPVLQKHLDSAQAIQPAVQ